MSTSSRDSQIKRDACVAGIAPCCPNGTLGRTEHLAQRAFNADQWQRLLTLSRAQRALLVESRGPSRMSLEFEAKAAGLVPHPETVECASCRHAQRQQRDAASIIRFEYRHPWATPDRVAHLTAWGAAR